MSNLVSSWSKNVQAVPESYILPEEKRPGDIPVPLCKDIPVVDLARVEGLGRYEVVQTMMKASQDFGIFQVINHGIPEELMNGAMSLCKEFFDMPAEEKAVYYSEDKTKSFRLYTNQFSPKASKVGSSWRDTLHHYSSHPSEEKIQSWPEKPARYREVVGTYAAEVKKLSSRLLDLICEGLGIELGYFGDELTKTQQFVVNHYPPCPDPSLVLGAGGHKDSQILTLLQQEAYGLQIFNDGKWVGVEPIPHAFLIGINDQLEIISNGKLKSALHRAVTNTSTARMSLVNFIGPSPESIIEPAKAVVSESNPKLFKPISSKDYFELYMVAVHGPQGSALELLKL
ncbi:hypothetical protein RHGRI_002846 [Rhododendron griersonianum]|uniref:Fe2OG dioxygenase domain-containing protein n=1 Tax=Rhododendron griersonianum TaxID=479676 RepID=A0AAV6LQK7_9ERIC|nr:hypothetical protein RHGRI_002846 [Rhododendron griersonianum]